MPIPKDILAVARPKNTFVVVYGKNKNLYAVRERLGCKYKEGRRVPVNGRTIGHIVDFKYVPIEKKIENISKSTKKVEKVDLKDWANIQLQLSQLYSSYVKLFNIIFLWTAPSLFWVFLNVEQPQFYQNIL